MEISKIYSIYFSPTGSTKNICNKLCQKSSKVLNKNYEEIDFTLMDKRKKIYKFGKNNLIIFGMPTYAGRLPNKIMPDVKKSFIGDQTPVINVQTYGNRNYDDSLIEQRIILEENGFISIGGMAAVCRHVFSNKIAKNRPDQNDSKKMDDFIINIFEKIKSSKKLRAEKFKGDYNLTKYYQPLKENLEKANFLKAKPKTDIDKCTDCKICAKVCPMGVIDYNDVSTINSPCIKCQACIVKCPENAKYFDDEDFLSHVKMLEKNYQTQKEIEFFYPEIIN